MNLLFKFDRALARYLEWVIVALFAVFLVLTCLLVVLRYGFQSSILGGNEFVTIAFIFTSALGGAVGISKREHIAITVFIDMLPHKLRIGAYVLGLALVAVMNAALVYLSFDWIARTGHNPWQPINVPQGIFYAAIPIAGALAILFCLLKIVLTLGGRENTETLWLPED
ncbi:MAG: TRAP transporter small permease subunit [Pseudomonadota bacterium]